jgi:ribosomal protein L33
MASTSSATRFDPQRIGQPPECAACGERMQLSGVERHNKFTRLETRRYDCDCGRTSEEAVPREA